MASPLLAKLFGRGVGLTGGTLSSAAGSAAGGAIRRTLDPVLQAETNAVWSKYADVPPDAVLLAVGVAQGQVTHAQAYKWAAETGYGKEQMDALVQIANGGPGVAAAYDLWRRGVIDETAFRRALQREGLEQEWIDDLVKVKLTVLDPADLARGIHRGLVPDPGLLEGELPSGEGNVPAYPVYPINALAEALAAGYDRDHLGVLVGLQGNPMGAHEAAQAEFRGVLTRNDYLRAIAEGNTRNEWADAIREQSRAIPSPTNYVEAYVRDWIDQEQFEAGAARHGMTADDAELLYLIHGRPLSWHQVWIGLARGGVYDGPIDQIDPAFLKSLRESNIRPEWYNLAWAQRYSYPAPFVVKQLAAAGDLDHDQVLQILTFEGWEPTLAASVAASWTTKGAASSSLTKSEIRAAYRHGKITEADALARLKALKLSPADAQIYLDSAGPLPSQAAESP